MGREGLSEEVMFQQKEEASHRLDICLSKLIPRMGRCKGPVVGNQGPFKAQQGGRGGLKQRERERESGDRCSCRQGLPCMGSCGLW